MIIDKARLYDLLYHWRGYPTEARRLVEIIAREQPTAKVLLDVGCGTAAHHPFLAPHFSLSGIDIEEAYLAAARRKNPDGRYVAADMTSFNLDRRFDVIISLFSAIGYVRTLNDFRRTAFCLAAHLRPGGLLIIEPWLSPQNWTDGVAHMHTYEDESVRICRMNVSRSSGNLSILDFHYLVAEQGGEVTHFTERHELGLFETADLLGLLGEAGISARFEEEGLAGRGLIIGRRAT